MNKYFNFKKKSFVLPVIMLLVFYSIAFVLYYTSGSLFYLLNFGYIGTAVAVGILLGDILTKKYSDWGRRITQLFVGLYMLVFLGLISGENMQIEGFFLYLFIGVFAGAAIHYLVAKVGGVLIFGRGWCGYACWTAMVLDFLPWKRNEQGRINKLGILRYLHFILALTIALSLWFLTDNRDNLFTFFSVDSGSHIELIMLITGNLVYYFIGIVLAAVLKDNRAFCKYVCPIPTIMKIGSRFSLMKIEIDAEKCIDCKLCEKVCLMDIKLLDYKNEGKRIQSTECILCYTCKRACPTDSITSTIKFDGGYNEKLNYRK